MTTYYSMKTGAKINPRAGSSLAAMIAKSDQYATSEPTVRELATHLGISDPEARVAFPEKAKVEAQVVEDKPAPKKRGRPPAAASAESDD